MRALLELIAIAYALHFTRALHPLVLVAGGSDRAAQR